MFNYDDEIKKTKKEQMEEDKQLLEDKLKSIKVAIDKENDSYRIRQYAEEISKLEYSIHLRSTIIPLMNGDI